jgi:hypothetical protein
MDEHASLDAFFTGQEAARAIFDAIEQAMTQIGPYELRISKSQVAFRHGKVFARVWIPGQYLHGKTASLVLTLSFPYRHGSPRWKEIVEPAPGHFTHHLELHSSADMDDEVRGWIIDARIDASSEGSEQNGNR